jgi:hypothetical protein
MVKVYLIFMLILVSCATTENLSLLPEDEMFVTRKYVGNLIEYKVIEPPYFGGPPSIHITTTQDTTYGKITVYSRKCEFMKGDRLYLRRIFQAGSWVYQLENDNISYRLSEFNFENKTLSQTWF